MATPTRYTAEMTAANVRNGFWTRTTFHDLVLRNATLHPEKEAVIDSNPRLTWASLKLWVERLALGLLEMGLVKDDMVVIQLPNTVELFALRLACEAAGLLCLPILRTYRQKELEYILNRTKASAIVIPWQFRDFDYLKMITELQTKTAFLKHIIIGNRKSLDGFPSVEQLISRPIEKQCSSDYLKNKMCSAFEYSLVLLTSGTIGLPKFVEYPVCTNMLRDRVIMEILDCNESDVIGVFSPAAGGANARAYYGALMVCARVVMMEHFEADAALQLIEKEKITIAPVVPAQLIMMARHPDFGKYDLSSLRVLLITAAALPYQVALECEAKFKCPILQNYSSIDCSVGCIGSPSDPKEVRLQTVGKPFAGAQLKIVNDYGQEVSPGEIGEVILRGPAGVSGYFKDAEATNQTWGTDGWFKMGDLGKLDESGNLRLVGRKKDIIIRGGQNIYPLEVESLLIDHPKVAAVAVVAMPDLVMGEKACACVVPTSGEPFTFEEMASFLKARGIATFKIPERLETRDHLPMVAGQKVDKKALQQDILEKQLTAEKST